MKLRFSPTSPYVRKVTVTLRETGQFDDVEIVQTNSWDPATDLPRDNPLGKVPALILDDGTVYMESAMICEYLDSLHGGARLYPAAGPARWQALRLHALANGMIDATIDRVVDSRRPEGLQWDGWTERRKTATARTLDILEQEVEPLGGDAITIGHVTLGCALGYLDLRAPADGWRDGRPKLAAWYADFATRDSMTATVPKDPAPR